MKAAARLRRARLTNWKGAPCPACAQPLAYARDLATEDGVVLVLLRCPRQHCWEERLSLATLHSGVFVERRRDFEPEPRD